MRAGAELAASALTVIRIGFETSIGWGQANPASPVGHTVSQTASIKGPPHPSRLPSPLRAIGPVMPLFDTHRFGNAVTPLSRSVDGRVLVMSQVTSVRQDLAAQGIAGVPAQEALLLADTQTGGTQRLALPNGGQIVQVFWTEHLPMGSLQVVPQDVLNALLAFHGRAGSAQRVMRAYFSRMNGCWKGTRASCLMRLHFRKCATATVHRDLPGRLCFGSNFAWRCLRGE